MIDLSLELRELKDPETVGTVILRPLILRLLFGGGGGRSGAHGRGGRDRGLSFFVLLSTSWSVMNVSGLCEVPKLPFHCCGSPRLRRMMRRDGPILLDFVLRRYIAVEITTVTITIRLMTPAATPNALAGLSLLCIKNAATGPEIWFCKKTPWSFSILNSGWSEWVGLIFQFYFSINNRFKLTASVMSSWTTAVVMNEGEPRSLAWTTTDHLQSCCLVMFCTISKDLMNDFSLISPVLVLMSKTFSGSAFMMEYSMTLLGSSASSSTAYKQGGN